MTCHYLVSFHHILVTFEYLTRQLFLKCSSHKKGVNKLQQFIMEADRDSYPSGSLVNDVPNI